jgi:hypothetical protein
MLVTILLVFVFVLALLAGFNVGSPYNLLGFACACFFLSLLVPLLHK